MLKPLRITRADIIARAEYANLVVVPVNTRGVMGAGLALAAKKRWPGAAAVYERACYGPGRLKPGGLVPVNVSKEMWSVGELTMAFLATKDDWRDPSRIEWITEGLTKLRDYIWERPAIETVFMPAIGCGLGQLRWSEVRPMIERFQSGLPKLVNLTIVDLYLQSAAIPISA